MDIFCVVKAITNMNYVNDTRREKKKMIRVKTSLELRLLMALRCVSMFVSRLSAPVFTCFNNGNTCH